MLDQGVTRSGFLAGVEGLAPYGIHIDAVAGVSQTGVLSARLEASYDILLSQKLIARPYLEAMLASKDDPAIQLDSGLARYEVGLRLRYEIVKEVAPFIGVGFEQFTGATANLVAAGGGATSNLRGLVGLKFWFGRPVRRPGDIHLMSSGRFRVDLITIYAEPANPSQILGGAGCRQPVASSSVSRAGVVNGFSSSIAVVRSAGASTQVVLVRQLCNCCRGHLASDHRPPQT